MPEEMNPPSLGVSRIEELKELQRKLGVQLEFEEDNSGLWNEWVFSYAILIYELFYKHYGSFPDFRERAQEAAIHNAVASVVNVIGRAFYNFRSLQSAYERKVRECLDEYIQREEAKRRVAPLIALNLNVSGPTPKALAIPAPKLLPINDVGFQRRAFVQPLLDAKGWSYAEWAAKANVTRHTVTNYLEAKRKTYHSNRKALADALGVSFQDFPK